MPGTSTKVNLDEARACHQQAGRILIDDLSSHDADLLQAYHRHVGELLDDYSNAIAEPTVSFRELLAANPDTITDDTEVIITAGELRARLDELEHFRAITTADPATVAGRISAWLDAWEAQYAELGLPTTTNLIAGPPPAAEPRGAAADFRYLLNALAIALEHNARNRASHSA